MSDSKVGNGEKDPGMPKENPSNAEPQPGWTFLSNHAHVLLLISRDPEMTLRAVADHIGITERAVQRIVADLETAGYLERERSGRRNRYKIHGEMPLRHPIEAHQNVSALLALMIDVESRIISSHSDRPDNPVATKSLPANKAKPPLEAPARQTRSPRPSPKRDSK
jgi:DNA-binding transcriptional ArsR family regulator